MSKIFITGSADGLGLLAARELVNQGHEVVLHARNATRAKQTVDQLPGAAGVLIADLSDIKETKALASNVNVLGPFDVVIHNAGVYRESNQLSFAVNTLAPYVLTCLIHPPKRLIYLSSGMHFHGDPHMDQIISNINHRNQYPNYSDTKLHDVILCLAVARKWKNIYANAVDPGWVPTKMGGRGAPGNLVKGYETQVWLAVSEENEAKVSGRYFHHKREKQFSPSAGDTTIQEKLLAVCEELTGVRFPASQQ